MLFSVKINQSAAKTCFFKHSKTVAVDRNEHISVDM